MVVFLVLAAACGVSFMSSTDTAQAGDKGCSGFKSQCATRAEANTPKVTARRGAGCDRINLGGQRVFYKFRMDCRTAKTYARRLYRTKGRSRPKNFTCTTGSAYRQGANCQHISNNRYFGWHPID